MSAYTTLSGRPAHPGALLWKVSHLILLEVEFWLIKVDVSIGGKELRIMVSNNFCSLSTHCLQRQQAWSSAMKQYLQPDIKLASSILRLKGDEREKFEASKVTLQNIAKLNEMSSKINFLCTK